MKTQTSYLGIGSNLGARELNVLRAVRLIETQSAASVVRCSGLYETEPVGVGCGGCFINAVAEVRPLLQPSDLLKRLKTIENILGRSGGHNQPREIDIDIITIGDSVYRTPELVLPHPRYVERAFVLVPLREIAPSFVCPVSGDAIGDLVRSIGAESGVVRISGRECLTADSAWLR